MTQKRCFVNVIEKSTYNMVIFAPPSPKATDGHSKATEYL